MAFSLGSVAGGSRRGWCGERALGPLSPPTAQGSGIYVASDREKIPNLTLGSMALGLGSMATGSESSVVGRAGLRPALPTLTPSYLVED